MKNAWRILDQLVFSAGFPAEVLPSTTLVELVGQHRVLIENHHGVIAYGKSEILVKAGYGTICVSGIELELVRMTKEQLVITGKIHAVHTDEGGK